MLMLTKPSAAINEMTALELQRGFVTWCESHPTRKFGHYPSDYMD